MKGDASTGQVPWAESSAALMKVQTDADRRRSIHDAIDFMVGHGLTMIHQKGGGEGADDSLESRYPYVMDLWREQKLKLRFRLRLSPVSPGIEGTKAMMANSIDRMGDEVLRLNGFAGIGAGGTAESFVEASRAVAAGGWSVHLHSVYLPEITGHVAGFSAANAVHPLKDLRWSLAHANQITPELVQSLKEMGVGIEGDAWPYTANTPSAPLGPPWRMLLDSGIHLGAGSDCTGAEKVNPWLTIDYMTTGRNSAGALANDPAQSITRLEALKIYTKGSAWHSFDEHHLGTLEVGKLADLAVLSDDVLTVSDDDLRKMTSTLTLQAGKIVHQRA